MMPALAALAIIPVRVGSQRLPRKALLTESGKELFLHTCDQAKKARNIDRVVVATDDDEVERAAKRHGYGVVRTSPACRTGSERCAEAAASIECKAVLDIQGDWPEVDPRDLEALVAQLLEGRAVTNTLAVPLTDAQVLQNPNVVKVVRGRNGKALYFSRAPIPWPRDQSLAGQPTLSASQALRHVGIYAYRAGFLRAFPQLPRSPIEDIEALEQLRVLWNGHRIAVHLTPHAPAAGVDTPQDLERVRRLLSHSL